MHLQSKGTLANRDTHTGFCLFKANESEYQMIKHFKNGSIVVVYAYFKVNTMKYINMDLVHVFEMGTLEFQSIHVPDILCAFIPDNKCLDSCFQTLPASDKHLPLRPFLPSNLI